MPASIHSARLVWVWDRRRAELSGVVLLQEVGYSSRPLGERRDLVTNGHEPDGLGEPVPMELGDMASW